MSIGRSAQLPPITRLIRRPTRRLRRGFAKSCAPGHPRRGLGVAGGDRASSIQGSDPLPDQLDAEPWASEQCFALVALWASPSDLGADEVPRVSPLASPWHRTRRTRSHRGASTALGVLRYGSPELKGGVRRSAR